MNDSILTSFVVMYQSGCYARKQRTSQWGDNYQLVTVQNLQQATVFTSTEKNTGMVQTAIKQGATLVPAYESRIVVIGNREVS